MKKLSILAFGALALALTGCGNTVAVTGVVKRGGQPLSAGMVAIEPAPGSNTC